MRLCPSGFLAACVAAVVSTAFAAPVHAACDPTLEVVEVEIKNMAYVPADLEVCLGQTVRWTNREDPSTVPVIRHTVTANPAHSVVPGNVILPEGATIFESAALVPGAVFEHTFTVLGMYQYICRPHELMGHIGRLTVVDPDVTPVE